MTLRQHDSELDNFDAQATYSGDDLSLSGLGKFAIHLVVLVGLSAVIVYGAYRYLAYHERQIEEEAVRTTLLPRERGQTPEELFPTPRLQTTALADWAKFHTDENQALDNYQWVDQGKGLVKIPIEEAKKRFLEEEAKKSAQERATPQGKEVPPELMRSSQ